jgi:hypothetical protein
MLSPLSGMTASSGQAGQPSPTSKETRACLACHSMFTPGIVEDWRVSRHASVLPADAVMKKPLERRVSAEKIPEALAGQVVGCYECHSLNADKHKDNFEHMGYKINVVVSPSDCSTCHPAEASQYSGSKKAHAVGNLMNNPVYHTLVDTITGMKTYDNGKISTAPPSDTTLNETCLACHGTDVQVQGMRKVATKMGEMAMPKLSNWPNQGVGRLNPDGSRGSCSACHPRHSFSIEVARKPYTCSQCHLEPDTPAWNVYKESKHGNIFEAKHHEWDFNAVPWTAGKDFKSPTCATCHNSLVTAPDGKVIAERSHDFGSRLWVRIFGLIYAHPQPKSGDTTIIRNSAGLPLPVTFTNEPATSFLIDKPEQDRRAATMKSVCNACHSSDWINGHFTKFDNTIQETNGMTLTATRIVMDAWQKGFADKTNPFDERIEQLWASQWLFYSNSIRYASAMTGAPDYSTFHHGWWDLTTRMEEMKEIMELKALLREKQQVQ